MNAKIAPHGTHRNLRGTSTAPRTRIVIDDADLPVVRELVDWVRDAEAAELAKTRAGDAA